MGSIVILPYIKSMSASHIFEKMDFHEFVESLVKTIEMRDQYTAGHSKRVSEFADLIARQLGLPVAEVDYIHIGGHLHDIGKIGIPDGVLLKTGKLSSAEYFMMQQHPVIGSTIFDNLAGFEVMAKIIRQHHERHDGKGYPDGLVGDEISLGAAIVSVADSFDAMTTLRTYREGMTLQMAAMEIYTNSGQQFNPLVAEAFCDLLSENEAAITEIIEKYSFKSHSLGYKAFNSVQVKGR